MKERPRYSAKLPYSRKIFGLLSGVLTRGDAALLGSPIFTADGVDCNTWQRQVYASAGIPSTPSDPSVTELLRSKRFDEHC